MFLRRFCGPLTALLLLVGCGKNNDNCPGLCPSETLSPTMVLSTADGAPSIASAKVYNSPCTAMLTHSAGEVGVPTGYAAVQVTYNGPKDNPPLCIVELTSLWGDVQVFAPQVKASPYQQTCCPYGTCCAKSSEVTQRVHLAFDPATQTVSFEPAPDGGMGSDAGDAGAETMDAEQGLDGLAPDTAELDLGGVDAEIDAANSDVVDIDAGSVDGADPIDLAIDA
jgi:hypothetical protein